MYFGTIVSKANGHAGLTSFCIASGVGQSISSFLNSSSSSAGLLLARSGPGALFLGRLFWGFLDPLDRFGSAWIVSALFPGTSMPVSDANDQNLGVYPKPRVHR
jgi:hypothetical protein